jgi:PTH1 family peptidyl-tRNA hydrolase
VWLLVGLGNPGREYEETRHNLGFRVLDAIAARAGGASAPRVKLGAEVSEARIGAERVLLCKPMEYMNVSGQAVSRVAKFWKVEPGQTVVVHDELDLPFGRMKLGLGGGHGGHNGIRSLLAEGGSPDFLRVRLGVGRPAPGRDAADYVLSPFSGAERRELPDFYARAAAAVECIVTDGMATAMNRFNGKAGVKPVAGDDV